ncbi:MAG: NAD(P)H-hydrate dehydratase [Alphaproteobacteria bacterium]|nr:NAD(P)H-hydrate dehydratase [Alphaproteobacteria bacterium]
MNNSPALWLEQWPLLKRDGHKYDRGHALIYGGVVMTGAARLAARAAQRIGAGLVTIAAPAESQIIYAQALESVIVRPVQGVDDWRILLADERRNAILVGPGMGTDALNKAIVLSALHTGRSCVLDADALTIFADEPQALFDALHANCVLTPHEGEFARLFPGLIGSNRSKVDRAVDAAKMAGCTMLLKGAETVIADTIGQCVVNNNAPPWLATAGAGDVLAGVILGLLAQKMPVLAATCAAAWLHGQIAHDFGPGMIAEDIVNGVPDALKSYKKLLWP